MASTIERIVRATVSKTSLTISRQGFSTGIGVHQVGALVQPNRFATYTSLQEMLDVGFTTSDTAYAWASTYLQQVPRPERFGIGRRVPGTRKQIETTITAPEVGTWLYTINDPASGFNKAYSYIASASDDDVSIAQGLLLQVQQDEDSIVTVPDAITTADFLASAGIAGTDFTAVTTPPGAGTATDIIQQPNANPEDMETCLLAIQAENNKDWYGFTIDTRTDADLLAAASFAASNLYTKIFVGQTQDDDMRTDTPGNIGEQLGDLVYDNVYLVWNRGDLIWEDAAALSIAMAADLDAENGAITWALQQYRGVGFTDLQEGEIDNIVKNNGNVHIEIAGVGVSQEGKAVSGEFMDIQTTIDWVKARSQEAVFGALASAPKVSGTNAGIAQVSAPFLGVLLQGVKGAHFSGDDPELPRVRTPTASERQLADRQNRLLRDVIGEAIFANAIHKVLLQINLSV